MKLQYDPQRMLKLRKNEILNEFRTRFSHNFYQTFKEAERQIWSGQDRNFEFVDEIFNSLERELESIRASLKGKVEAWSSVERAENIRPVNHFEQPEKISYTAKPEIENSAKKELKNEESPFFNDDFDFFDEV